MFELTPALIALFASALLMGVIWAIQLRDGDASIVDPLWGLAILLNGVTYSIASDSRLTGLRLVVLLVTGAWALRLAWHLGLRHAEVGEDRRYRKMREARGERWWWQSFFVVFLLQAALAWVVALPLMAVVTGPVGADVWSVLGVLVALFGLAYESIADGQLADFRRRAAAAGDGERGVMDSGLWRYSRHPNYFGESVVWWGIALVAVSGGAWWGLFGPALLTFMLLKVSGVSMTEAEIEGRRPAYGDYIRSTNAFLPGKPKQRL